MPPFVCNVRGKLWTNKSLIHKHSNMSRITSKIVPSRQFVADPPRSLNESIANIKAYATKLVDDNRNGDITDGKRQGWRLLEVLFPIEFYELTGATPPLALQHTKPIQRAQFDEDEAQIRRDKEAQNALRQEVRAAKKRKRDAVEEAKVRLAEKVAIEKRLAYERTKRRRVNPEADQGNSVAPVKVPFVTPNGDPVLPGDSLTDLWTAIATGKFAIPGTASNPVTSEIRAVLAKHLNQAQTPQPSASTSQAETPQPSASTSQAKGAKTPRRQPAAGRKKAAASKEAQAQILNPPVLLSPISPKPKKGKARVRPTTETPDHLSDADALKRVTVLLRRCDEVDTGAKPVKTPKPRKKSLFNPPSKELVEAAAEQTARRKSLQATKEIEVNLADSAKNLYGEDLEELPSEREDELLKEPAQVPATIQAAVEQTTRPVSKRSGLRIDSGDESEPELQLTADDEEAALKEAALKTLPKAAE
ncbi:hypothetical protein DAPPUDRAFT_333090 [Daphnia pulex]|uniref:Uncharacterized protein n=1 Tax=Daphnia pulex TaxID=6669 RepID=E9HRT9_DAPPU|nr:hypothetical protein DAPPUDRAFT_333090 [Daphnia pulex]|eukprot:EFX65559.1 hypothetical protein DAPPUDRAFT_333090 [Daphnia pulex]